MRNKVHTLSLYSRKELAWLIAGILAIGMFLGVAMACVVYISAAEAEDGMMYNCWALCQPGNRDHPNEVLIREKPGKHAEVVGAVQCGDRMVTDGREKGGWIHVVQLANETGEGWISARYVVYAEPEIVNEAREIIGGGRVACRKWIDGKRTAWVRAGSYVTVYAMADGWAVTDVGYIQSRYIGGAE